MSGLTDFAIHLPPVPAQVGRVRGEVRERLFDWGLADYVDDVTLLVSELVTNAVRHGVGPIELFMVYRDGRLLCEVRDDGVGAPYPRSATVDDTSGRGLELVARLIGELGGDWGVILHDGRIGKGVYIVVPVTQRLTS